MHNSNSQQNGFQTSAITNLNGLKVPAWRQLGSEVNALRWSDAMRQANLDWTVSKEQHKSARTGELIDAYGVYRDDNDAFLGQVGNIFTPIQNLEQFQFVDSLIESVDGAHYVAAGALDGGEQVFCVAEIDAFDVASAGDKHRAFVVFRDFKNSKGSGEARVSLLREVCTNGLHRQVGEKALRFRHTTNVKSRMQLASASVGIIKHTFDEIRGKLETLATRRFQDSRTVENILEKLFPPTPLEIQQNRINNRREEAKMLVAQLLVDNDSDAFPEQAGTAYALFNSVTNYVDHEKEISGTRSKKVRSADDSRAVNSLFGGGSDFKSNALDLILRETAHVPSISRSYSIGGGAQVIEFEEVRSQRGEGKSLLDQIVVESLPLKRREIL